MQDRARRWATSIWLLGGFCACGCDVTTPPTDTAMVLDAGGSDTNADGGGILPANFFAPFTPPFDMTTSAPATIQVSMSAEALGELGYTYNASPGPTGVTFVDGWNVRFDHYIVVVGSVTIAQQGSDPAMRSVVGATVARRAGPWIIDGHRHGSIAGAGGSPETAIAMFVFNGPDAGGSFGTTTQYAFSFQNAQASASMINVNLVEADRTIVENMVTRHWTHYVSGTATYSGRAATATVDPTFQPYPTSVHFGFGFSIPTAYVNCHNPVLGPTDVPANRGIRPSSTGAVRAQLTFHTDHSFWDQAEVEGARLRFDAYAARVPDFGMMVSTHPLGLMDFVGVPPAALVDHGGMPVRDRGLQTMGYTPGMGAPPVYALNGAAGIADLRDWFGYLTRGQGHLNSDGLCFVASTGAASF